MPRQARLDLPGLLQHVIVRGIERREIFRDDKDRAGFVARLSGLLEETGTDCYAWALIPNHFHLVLRPRRSTLAAFMRRLQTGYAVCFNLRHNRSGHLFQNRYKSIVCEEEAYLLELVRYVHLNPLRANLVADLKALERYPWSGHPVLLGKREMPGQQVDDVLGRFGRTIREARQRYQEFVGAGVAVGQRPDLVGGGLRRSLAAIGATRERIAYDAQVLGAGEFVTELRREERLRERLVPALSLAALVDHVAAIYEVSAEALTRYSRRPGIAEARGVICYLAVEELGYRNQDLGVLLHLSSGGVSMAVRRGAKQVATEPRRFQHVLDAAK